MKLSALLLICMFLPGFAAAQNFGLSYSNGAVASPPTPVFPTPPPGSQVFSSLQNATGTPASWILCDGTCAGSTAGETGTSSFTQSIASPSLSGSSAEQQSQGTTAGDYWNTLYTLKVPSSALTGGSCSAVTGADIDKWVYIPSGNNAEGYEYDPDLWCPVSGTGYKYVASLQCPMKGSSAGHWRLFNAAATPGTGWTATSYVCDSTVLSPNTWHHIQLHVSYNQTAQTYTYGAFFFDGSPVSTNLNVTYSAKVYSPAGSGVVQDEQQIDGYTTPQNNIEYIDNVTLTVEF